MGDPKKDKKGDGKPAQASEDYEVGTTMSLDEYFLQIMVEETTNLDTGERGICDPIVKVLAMNQEKFSSQHSEISTETCLYWGDHFFFSKKFTIREEMENDFILLQVFDKGTLGRKAMIGEVRINLTSIYFEKDRTISHQWMVLQNKAKDFEKVMGYVKLSANLVKSGESRVTYLLFRLFCLLSHLQRSKKELKI